MELATEEKQNFKLKKRQEERPYQSRVFWVNILQSTARPKQIFMEQQDYSSSHFYDNKHPKPKNPFVT